MGITDKDAYYILQLPLGAPHDAIADKYKKLFSNLSNSKNYEDKQKLDQVYAAYTQLIPEDKRINIDLHNNKTNKNKSKPGLSINNNQFVDHLYTSSSEDDFQGKKDDLNGDKKCEKKKSKKKKRKGKKKTDKLNGGSNSSNYLNEDSDSDGREGVEEEEIDRHSAFVSVAGKKILNYNSSNTKGRDKTNGEIDPNKQLEARKYAMLGNEEANKGCYDKAVKLFSHAIHLDMSDHRFFGNRSYCYDQLMQFEKALKDADNAIALSPEWPKGHFRRGRALKGLNNLMEAEKSYEKVLRYDQSCQDAIVEINKVRKRRIVEMGFTEKQAKAALRKYVEVQAALDALLSEEFRKEIDNLFLSEDEEEPQSKVIQNQPKDLKMNPKNPEGFTSLWVGNVVPDLTEKMLIKLFSKYGRVVSVRLLREKYCAFVNYATKASAGQAMEELQGKSICGSKLLIKFPDNPIANGAPNIVLRKTTNAKPEETAVANGTTKQEETEKIRGPVNGNECYFWRTTGCYFNESCKYKHIPDHKGIDKKTWQK